MWFGASLVVGSCSRCAACRRPLICNAFLIAHLLVVPSTLLTTKDFLFELISIPHLLAQLLTAFCVKLSQPEFVPTVVLCLYYCLNLHLSSHSSHCKQKLCSLLISLSGYILTYHLTMPQQENRNFIFVQCDQTRANI